MDYFFTRDAGCSFMIQAMSVYVTGIIISFKIINTIKQAPKAGMYK